MGGGRWEVGGGRAASPKPETGRCPCTNVHNGADVRESQYSVLTVKRHEINGMR